MRRCDKHEVINRVIDNDRINMTTVQIPFTDQLAGFEVFYRESTDSNFIQLQKKIVNSKAIKEPFCYYKLKNDNLLELTFSTRENYFKPLFNSELKVEYYTTDGTGGNFELYTGADVEVYGNYEKYENNAKVPVIAITQSASTTGEDIPDLLELRDRVANCFATVDSYTTESDLQRHFDTFDISNDVKVSFIKKRDDIFDRLYTSYSLCKDSYGSYYKTNTLQLKIYRDQFDHQFEQSDRMLLKPSNIFIYEGNSTQRMIKVPKDDMLDLAFNSNFIYQNPFLITVSNNGAVGYYLNNIHDKIPLDYEYVNNNSMVQFICNNLYVNRSSVKDENTYTFRVHLTATDMDIESPMIDEDGNDTGRVSVVMSFLHKNGKEAAYIECEQVGFESEGLKYIYEGKVTTDDFISLTESVRLYDLKDTSNGSDLVQMIPMTDLKMNIYTFFNYDEGNDRHNYTHLPGFENTTMTNKYTTEAQRVELITPLTMLKSHMTWEKDELGSTFLLINDVPVMKHDEFLNEDGIEEFDRFVTLLSSQYDYMDEIMSKKTNNYSIDMKFYNTYGRSNNFVVGDEQERLNHVNCTLELKVCPYISLDGPQLIQDMKIFIKDYFENVNKDVNEGIFISNLIQELENTFTDIKYLKFVSLNGYSNDYQSIENTTVDVTTLDKASRILFVPEYLNIELDDIIIELIN
jgi:hypothetical protein